MKKRLQRFFKGRYGADQLSMVLIILSLILTLLGSIKKWPLLMIISYIPLIISFYRIFSRDINKRRMENYKFYKLFSPLYKKYNKYKRRFKNRKKYKYLDCPSCSRELRVPRGKGRMNITCPRCGEKFEGRS